MYKKKKILIVGGMGVMGQKLSSFCLRKGHKVNIITNNKFNYKKDKNLKIITIDITNKDKIKKYLNNFKKLDIYYLASSNLSSTQNENSNFTQKNINANVIGLINFLEILCLKKKFKIFYTCSCHIFNNQTIYPQNENTLPKFSTTYSLTKFMGKEICEFYRKNKNIFCNVGIMYTNVSENIKSKFLIKTIIAQLRSDKKSVRLKNPGAKFDIMSTNDAINAMYLSMNMKKSDTYIISSFKLISVKEIFKIICEKIGINKKLLYKKKKNFKKIYMLGNNSKIIKKTRWELKDNINQIIDYFI